ncbi:MAG: outer membrane protein assembly factor BamE [Rubrivivax sp.]
MISSRHRRALSKTAMRHVPIFRGAAVALAAALLSGCSSWVAGSDSVFGLVSPYRIDVQQGNVVTQEQLARVKTGMNRLQVRDILGSPLLVDTFHVDRWDYVFTLRQGSKPLQRRSVVLTFDGEILKTIDAPELPTEREFVDSIARSGRIVAAADLELSPEQLKALPIPARSAPVAPADGIPNPIPTTRTFPPLEPS